MASSGTTLASGTRVALRYARESTRGTTPAGIATPVTSISAIALTSGTGTSVFARGSGSFVTDGFVVGQYVKTEGFTTSANNATWRVTAVSALQLTVEDTGAVVTDETAATAQQVSIVMVTLRATGRNVNLEKDTLESGEVDADSQETDVRHGFNRVAGAPGFQLSLADFDDWLEFITGGLWYTVATTGGPTIAVTTSNSFTRSGGSWITDGYRPGDIVRATGFATANNGDHRVTAVSTTVLTTSSALTNESSPGGEDIAFPGKRLDIGTDLCTMVLERAFQDVGRYQVFNGCAVDAMQLQIQPEAIVGGTFTVLGMSAAAMSSSALSAEAVHTLGTNTPFAAFEGEIYEGGSVIGVVTGVDINLQRNLSLNPIVGSRFSPDVFQGTFRCPSTLTAYFQDETLFNKFVNETSSSMWVKVEDPEASTSFINVVAPNVKYVGGSMDPPQEGPVPLEMPCRFLKASDLAKPSGATVNSMISIQRSNS